MSADKKPETTTITAEEAERAFRGTWHPVAFDYQEDGSVKLRNLPLVTPEQRADVLERFEELLDDLPESDD